MSIVHVYDAVALMGSLLDGSTARTLNVCCPSVRDEYAFGLRQAEKTAPSRLHSNVAWASSSANVNVAVVLFVTKAGADKMTGVGV